MATSASGRAPKPSTTPRTQASSISSCQRTGLRIGRADLRALKADLALVIAERVVDEVQPAAPALGHLRTLVGVLARDLRREEVLEGDPHALGDAGARESHRSMRLPPAAG